LGHTWWHGDPGTGIPSAATATAAALQAPAGEGKPLLVHCVGDSITKGSGASNVNRTAYPAQLQRLLGKKRFVVRNFGVGGSTVLKKSTLPYWDTFAYAESLAPPHPDVVVCMWGTNDAKRVNWDEKKYERDYLTLLRGYQALPSRPVTFVMVSPPLYMARHEIQWDMQPTVVNTQLPKVIRRVAAASGSVLIDVFEAMGGAALTRLELFVNKSRPRDKNDGCHPNDAGYQVLAGTVAEAFHAHLPASAWGGRVEEEKAEGEASPEEVGGASPQDIETGQEPPTTAPRPKQGEAGTRGGDPRRTATSIITSTSTGTGTGTSSGTGGSARRGLGQRRHVVVTCVGDSLTEGLGASRPNGSYPAHLQRLLSAIPALADARVVVVNYGVRGTTAMKAPPRTYWSTAQHQRLLALQSPSAGTTTATTATATATAAVVLMFGTNDASVSLWNETAFVADYAALVRTYARLPGRPTILVATPPPVYFRSKYDQEEDVRSRLPAIVAQVAARTSAHLLHVHDAAVGGDDGQLAADAEIAQRLAQAFEVALHDGLDVGIGRGGGSGSGSGGGGGGGGGGDGGGNGVRVLIDTSSPKRKSLKLFVLARNTRRSTLVAHTWSNRYVIFVVWHKANV
jgi:lysophospholipase L1-like esterase